MSGPPPWTTTGFMPTYLSSTTSRANSSRSAGSVHRRAAVLDDDGLAVELADVRERLEQRGDVARRRSAHVVYSALIGHVLVAEVGEEDLGLVALAGQVDRRTRPRRPRPPGERLLVVERDRRAGRAHRHALDRDVEVQRRGASSAPPTACAMRPQFGSPPCSAVLTSGELATARAARSTARRSPPRTTTRPTRFAPSPSRTISSASWRSSASSASPKRQLVVALGLDLARPLAPLAIRIAVSFVESWPSTEMRSKERLTVTPSSRSAVSGVERRVGLHEAQHRREVRRDHARALRLGAQRAPCPTGSLTRSAARFSNASVVRIAAAKSPVAVGRSSSPRGLQAVGTTRRPGAARRSRRSSRRRRPGSMPASAARRRSASRRRSPARARRSPRWRCRR